MPPERPTRRLLKHCIPLSHLLVLILSLTFASGLNLEGSGASFTVRDVTMPLPQGLGHISADKVILPWPGSDAALRLVNVLVSIDLNQTDKGFPAPEQGGNTGRP